MTNGAEGVRRSVLKRNPVNRRVLTPQWRGLFPGWVRQLAVLLVLLLLLLAALIACGESEKPVSLTSSTLTGPRLAAGPICLEEAVDVSDSMTVFTAQRELAEQALFDFATRVLDDNDLFSAAFFANKSAVALPPTRLSALTVPPAVPDALGGGTNLAPAVDALVEARAKVPAGVTCAARALIVVTDGVLGDDPAVLEAALRAGTYSRVFAVVPAESGWGRPAGLIGGFLDAVTVHHFTDGGLVGRAASIIADAKPLDVVYGEIIGSLTGQALIQLD
ncbi:vWA domain-containing protein [Actinokineospora sp. 24-640]